MANETKTRGIQLIRTDESIPGKVSFYDRREANAQRALIGTVDLESMPREGVLRFAARGITGNLLDSSNKLEGAARIDWLRGAIATANQGIMASTAVDADKLRQNAIDALVKLGLTAAAAAQIVDKRG